MTAIFQTLVDGVFAAAVFTAVAVAFNVVYRSGRVFNIAQGEMIVLSTFMTLTFVSWGLSPWLAMGAGIVLMGVLGIVVERLVLRRLVGQPELSSFMATLGLLLVIQGASTVVFGLAPQKFPPLLGTASFEVAGVFVKQSALIGVLAIALLVWALFLLFNRTKVGLGMTAVAESHQVARSLGINVKLSMAISWVIAGALSGFVTLLYASGRTVTPEISSVAFVALPVVLLAGLESIGGVAIAALIVGVGQAAAARWFDPYTEGGASLIFPFALMLVLLLIRPQGLFGWKRVERL
ncbi:branched-chain amino acid ABC transporter permease [Acrocarpospora pleiomorpha]|uniref:Branched-chain amino acid ABC transporter permease n=1 Tax=Acrocarpospora pleiomorpha TaxID=90975 RepID=A0A5M3XJS0_9ACTN|nr:branched-chain amino acid ABC transporter permease [Acrocarpospora pleiomorpha]GES19373.1 branched-chain amino acid ABC transporter permease [Acrocarpospora pleiomorpha]